MSVIQSDIPVDHTGIQLGVPESLCLEDKMFYHKFRTSSELCSAGLFSYDSETSTKKHRKMKCNFCHSVLSGWKDKFCRHLDKCERAQTYFMEHPVNLEYELLQRKTKRQQIEPLVVRDPKRQHVCGDLFSLDYDSYLSFLASGFVCSTGVSRNIFENDFLKNLFFSLHWQPPSQYILQKKISEYSSLIRTKMDYYFQNEIATGLIVYPWMDINKRFTVSYLLCSSTGLLSYMTTHHCNQETWGSALIFQQIKDVIGDLNERGVHITSVYYDDSIFFNDCCSLFLQDDFVKYIPISGNSTEWCKAAFSELFTHPSLLGFKQYVATIYHAISKEVSVQDQFFQMHAISKKELKFSAYDEENWVSVFSAIKFILDYYEQIGSTVEYCFGNSLLTANHPLFGFIFSEEWKSQLHAIYNSLIDLVKCTLADVDININRYYVYSIIHSTLDKVKMENNLPDGSAKYIESVLSNMVNSKFDKRLLCWDHFLTYRSDNSGSTFSDLFTEEDMLDSFNAFYISHEDCEECVKEFNSFMKNSVNHFDRNTVIPFWYAEGRSLYPFLSKLALTSLCYPHVSESYSVYSKIKSLVHQHVRSKKEGEANSLKGSDEMIISCNRHLVIRWNLDFQ